MGHRLDAIVRKYRPRAANCRVDVMMHWYECELLATQRREEAIRRAELSRLVATGWPRRRRTRVRHQLAHALIALALRIDDAPWREPSLAGA